MPTVTVNGEERDLPPETTLLGLITESGLDPDAVVAELNREIVPGEAFATTILSEGDRLELLAFVGGG